MKLKTKNSRMKVKDNEVEIRIAKDTPLSPSMNLINRFKFQRKTMGLNKAWENFIIDFIFEMDNDEAIQGMKDIATLLQTQNVVLICTCTDGAHCHRNLVKRMIENRYL